MNEYNLTFYNEYNEECYATFGTNEHHSLMELLFDKYIEDWADCRVGLGAEPAIFRLSMVQV